MISARHIGAGFLSVLILCSLPAFAQRPDDRGSPHPEFDAAPPVLRKALFGGHRLHYIGTRIVDFRRNGVTTHHAETITRAGNFVRIDFPEGSPQSGQVIVENSRERRHYFPDKNEIHILPPRHDEAFERLKRLVSKGTLSTMAGQPVAGLHTEQVVVSDKDGNVVERLFIHPESGMILKRQLFDAVGTPVGGFEFISIEMDPQIDPAVFKLRRNGATILTPVDLLERTARKSGFSAAALPPSTGFRLEGSVVRKLHGTDVLQENYGGPFGARLTLFQLKTSISPDRLRQYADRQDYQFVYWHADGNTFVLVGSVDTPTLLQVAGPLSKGTATAGR